MTNRRIGKCTFCGKSGDITDDHVPPKNLFRGYPNSGLIKVPACQRCNGGSALDDEYFRAFLVPQQAVAEHPQAQTLNAHIRNGFDTSHRKGFEERMKSQLRTMDFITPSGMLVPGIPVMFPEYDRIEGSLKKIIRGLYYHLAKEPLHPICRIAVADLCQIDEIQKRLPIDLSHWREGLARVTAESVYDVFSYKTFMAADQQGIPISVWLLTFFENLHFFGITYPKNLAEDIKLLSPTPSDAPIPWR